MMGYYSRDRENFTDFLQQIPDKASLTDVYLAEGKASERFRAYQFVLEKEG